MIGFLLLLHAATPVVLSVAEVAALADMDERSVRNAMNPKLPDPLVTEAFGKRSFIAASEARRWLAGRKGYRATLKQSPLKSPAAVLQITGDLAQHLQQAATNSHMAVETYLANLLAKEAQS